MIHVHRSTLVVFASVTFVLPPSSSPCARSFSRSPSPRHPPLTQYPFPPRSLGRGGQTSQREPRLVVSHSTCPPLSSPPHAHSFVLGTAVINIIALSQGISREGSRATAAPHLLTRNHCHVRELSLVNFLLFLIY
jgi:hypothetical protein